MNVTTKFNINNNCRDNTKRVLVAVIFLIMCKHENVSFVQTIEAFHQRIFNGLEYFCNNEYGNSIRVQVGCDDCGFEKTITHKNQENQPEWIKERIEIMKLKDEWFFT